MNDTPRTEKAREQYRMDVYEPNLAGFVVAEPVHASFARSLERENAELQNEVSKLRKKHEDALKLMGLVMTQPTDISVALANAEREKWVQCDQLEELRKDKERLDWLVDNTAISMLLKGEDGEEWWVELDYGEARNDIDREMKRTQ